MLLPSYGSGFIADQRMAPLIKWAIKVKSEGQQDKDSRELNILGPLVATALFLMSNDVNKTQNVKCLGTNLF